MGSDILTRRAVGLLRGFSSRGAGETPAQVAALLSQQVKALKRGCASGREHACTCRGIMLRN